MDLQNILLTVFPIAFGFVVKYHPNWKGVPNALIPYFTFAIALLTKLAGVGADTASVAYTTVGFSSVLGTVVSAAWVAIQNSLIYEVFLKGAASKVLQKPV